MGEILKVGVSESEPLKKRSIFKIHVRVYGGMLI